MSNSMLTYTDMPDAVLDKILYDVQHGLPENPQERCDAALSMLSHVGERINAIAGNSTVPQWLETFLAVEEKAAAELLSREQDDTTLYHQGTQDLLKRIRAAMERQ